MCIAVPLRVERVDGGVASVLSNGQLRQVSLALIDDEVAVGDYLLVRNGGFAHERLDAEHALQTLALIGEAVAAAAGSDLQRW